MVKVHMNVFWLWEVLAEKSVDRNVFLTIQSVKGEQRRNTTEAYKRIKQVKDIPFLNY